MAVTALPENWISCRLGDLLAFEYGKSLTKSARSGNGEYPVFGSSGVVGLHDAYLVEGPVIIVGRKGAAGSVCYSEANCWPIDTTYYIRSGQFLNSKFVYYLLHSLNLAKLETSTAIPGLNREKAYDETVFLPPLAEQHRIVAKIEELFSELDQGVASLKAAREQLKVYRQSLLKNAFEGKLTVAWRAAHADQLESATVLQQRIARERQARYQQQLTDWQTAGQAGPKPKPPKPLPPLTAEELAALPGLPEGWGWVKLGEIISLSSGSALTASQMKPGLFPVYGGNGVSGFHDEYLVESAQLILGRVGVKCGVVHITRPKSWITDNALIVSFLIEGFDLGFMKYCFENLNLNKVSVSTAQPVISGSKIYPVAIALPALTEQQVIAQLIDTKLSEADQLDQTLATALQQADALRQAILKKAFHGQLVPQDQNDEPAAALLERIRADKSNGIKSTGKRGKSG